MAGISDAGNVRGAMAAQEMPLHGLQARVRQAVAEEPPNQQQQVEVAVGRGRPVAVHSKARLEQRPVEASTVVRHEPGIRRRLGPERVEQGALFGVVRQGQLQQSQPIALPPRQADQEGDRAGGAAQAGRLGVQAEEGSGGRRHPRQAGQSIPIDRQIDGPELTADVPAARRLDGIAIEPLCQPPGQRGGIYRPDVAPDRLRRAEGIGRGHDRGDRPADVGIGLAGTLGPRRSGASGGLALAPQVAEAAVEPRPVHGHAAAVGAAPLAAG